MQRIRISKHKIIDITTFEANFGRKCNTPSSNITTNSYNNNLNYNQLIKHYLDKKRFPGRAYLTKEQWADASLCSDTEIEKIICAANIRAHRDQEKMKDGESRLMWSEGIARLISRSERRVQVKIARKIYASQRQEKNMDKLNEILPPGSTIGKVSPTTNIRKEPKRLEVKKSDRKSDSARFGTRKLINLQIDD